MDRMQRLQRKWILIGLILWFTETVMAQAQTETVNDSILLQEVVVQGARVVNKADGKWIFPTNRQKESSPNTFSLLGKLTLSHIKVDEVQHTLSAPEHSEGRKAKHMEKTMNLREYDDGMIKHDDAGK